MAGPLLIADIPWLLYRSFFALPSSITDDRGRSVNALLGTVNALLGVIEGRLPAQGCRAIVGCMGAEEADYRVALYPGYHAHREAMPEALAEQWGKAPALLEALGWAVRTADELEADDVMFSLACVEEEAGGTALLLTGDRDLYGAVSEGVAVMPLKKSGPAEVGPGQVREIYGVEPRQVADFIALRGDPSDGIPGAPGIGAKTAAELLGRYGTLEGILRAAGVPEVEGDFKSTPSRARAHARASQSIQTPPARPEEPIQTPPARPEEPIQTPPANPQEPIQTPPAPPQELRGRTAASLREHAAEVRTFKELATLQRIDVERPEDRLTDFAGGARAAGELGMGALARRLEALGERA
jgi:DNA polymerase-1